MQKPLPKAPTSPARPTVTVVDGQGSNAITITAPLTARDIAVLKARRQELSNQLESVDSRRASLLKQVAGTGDETARQGLENRISLLDKRQLQLETDLASTGQQLSSAPAGLATTSESQQIFGGLSPNRVETLGGIFIVFFLAPLAIGAARRMWKRPDVAGPPPAAFTETAQRLERLEQAVDAIAVEIERVSEGQRFVTKLLSEGQPVQKLGAGQRPAEPVRKSQ